ncbi:cyclase family protein [Candidatus Calescamantes bacterium]|nr:cyclase family protein [Candidatus Calescamantes bacterium]
MEWIDVSLPVNKRYPPWPGHIPFALSYHTKIEDGAEANNTYFQMSSHFCTHIDAPKHFIPDGETIETIPLSLLIGPCRVYELNCKKAIGISDIRNLDFHQVKRVIFKTSNSQRIHDTEFHKDYIGIDTSAAHFLVKKGIKVLGTDYYSVALLSEAAEVHRILLGAKCILLEGLDLSKVKEGDYLLVALPLKITGSEAAPARILLGRE